jgi:hypothetical protein
VRKAVSTGILAYGCWKGSFEGIGLGMVTIHPDPASIGRFYGRPLTAQEVLSNEKLAADYVPALANLWQDTLATLAD